MKKHGFFDGLKLNIKFTVVVIITIAITMAVLASVLFYEQERNVINESMAYMEHKTERNESQIETCIDSINMSTQFFLADEEMLSVLNAAAEGKKLDLQRIVDFKENDIKNLERLVSNNPLLYGVRVYAAVHYHVGDAVCHGVRLARTGSCQYKKRPLGMRGGLVLLRIQLL